MTQNRKITCEEAVLALKKHKLSISAKDLLYLLPGSSSRAVATALRKPTEDGRVKLIWKRKLGVAYYRFVRLSPKLSEQGDNHEPEK
jgi:hypothetical protein